MSRNWNHFMTASVGLMVGSAGMLLYHYLVRRRYVLISERELNRLHVSLENLKSEFEELKEDMKNEFEELK